MSATVDKSLLSQHGVGDAHCHAQDDQARCNLVPSLSARYIAVMGTRADDWGAVEELQRLAPDKVIPCFGVHPWFAHLHDMAGHEAGQQDQQQEQQPTKRQLQPQSEHQIQQQQQQPQQQQQHSDHPHSQAQEAAGHDCSPLPPVAHLLEPSPKDDPRRHPHLAALRPAPAAQWLPRLRQLLAAHPQAIVGEFGLDRSSVVPGTRLQPSWEHQLLLVKTHLALAVELHRPVSMHCVQGYGHLQELLRQLGPEGCPPKIMLHSYGGSVDLVKGFTKLPKGVGDRIYFSFSAVINARGSGAAYGKLLERVRAVPERRLLVESDQCTAAAVDGGLYDMLGIVAEARGWSVERAAEVTTANFREFYAASLQAMGQEGSNGA